jgi:hypothetical protein
MARGGVCTMSRRKFGQQRGAWLVMSAALVARSAAAQEGEAALVETFDYPGAERIERELGIVLSKGDGQILLADCSGGAGLVRVEALSGTFCFRITAATGELSFSIPDPFGIRADDHALVATVLLDGVPSVVPLRKNAWTGVGLAQEGVTEAELLELKATDGPSEAPAAPVASPYPFVARLDIGRDRACTGVLVGRRWAISARSCFGDGVVAGPPPRPTTLTVGRGDVRQATGRVVEVVELAPRIERDLVMARLAEPIDDVEPVRLATSPSAPAEALLVAGYGRTSTEWVPHQLHVGTVSVVEVGALGFQVTKQPPTVASTCLGDGGGPALRETSAGVELVGVHSTSWQDGCLDVSTNQSGASETRVDDLVAWIRSLSHRQGAAVPVAGDVDGDGWADVSDLYDFPDGSTAVLWQRSTGAEFSDPELAWEGSAATDGRADTTLWTRGDFNGDGLSDLAGFREESDGSLSLHALASDGLSVVSGSEPSWTSATMGWEPRALKVAAGDIDGDGTEDLLALHARSDDRIEVWIFRGDPTASDVVFSTPTLGWLSSPGQGHLAQVSMVSGNFDGDAAGRDDLALLWRTSGREARLVVYASDGTGFDDGAAVWTDSSGAFPMPRVALAAIDLTGDELRDEVVALHPAGDGTTVLRVFRADAADVWTGESWWTSPPGALDARRARLYGGDYDGDGLGDIAILDDSAGAVAALHRFITKPDGTGFYPPDLAAPAWSGTIGAESPRPPDVSSYDADGDGFGDIAAFYNYDNALSRMWLFQGAATGLETPREAWSSGAGNWDWHRTKLTSGDYDGDGFGDVAALYNYDNDLSRIFVFQGKASGPDGGHEVWSSGVGNWNWHRTKLTSGDFNGDGFGDIAALYNYDSAVSGLFVFEGSASGLGTARGVWSSGGWDWNRTKLTSGDFDGDGFGDVAALYNYDNSLSRIFVFRGAATGPGTPGEVWSSGIGNWDWNRTQLTSGDYDGDGFGDIAALYNYDNALSRIFVFQGAASGLQTGREVWFSGIGNWEANRTKLTSGDFDGDGFSDIAALYNYDNDFSRFFLFGGTGSGLGTPRDVWSSGAGNWDWRRTQLH